MVVRWIAAALLLATFALATVVVGRELGVDREPELAAPRPAPTIVVLDPIAAVELDERVRDVVRLGAVVPRTFPASMRESEHVASYAAAEERSGWRLLRHPDHASIDVTVLTSDGEVVEVIGSLQRDGHSFTLEQRLDADGVDPSGFSMIDDDASTVRTGPYLVTYDRFFGEIVYARFETGASFDGTPIVAEVSGPDLESVELLVSQLTFRD